MTKKKSLVLISLLIFFIFNGCNNSGKNVEINTIEDVFTLVDVGINESDIPKKFVKTNGNIYSGYIDDFQITLHLEDHIVKRIEATILIQAGDHSYFQKVNNIKQKLFYSNLKQLDGNIITDYVEPPHNFKIETNTWGKEYCYYEAGYTVDMAKELNNAHFLTIHYDEGQNPPSCDDIRDARSKVTTDAVNGNFTIRKYLEGHRY